MTLPLPQLDNQTFDELMAEARKLIPRYAPEWTDYNIHDPGITFIELFAWLTELQRYYLDRVRDENYLKFLKLLGIQLKDANPATTDVTFSLNDPQMLTPVLVPQGTKLTTKEQISFETDTSVTLVPAHINKIIRSSTTGLQENLDSDRAQGLSFYAFGEDAEVGSALYLGFEPLDLFDWDKVPSCEENADTERLKQYLAHYLNIDWIKNIGDRAINKIDDDRTIVITDEENELALELDRSCKRVKVTGSSINKPVYFLVSQEDKLIVKAQPFPANVTIPLTFNLFENYPVAKGKHREEPVFIPSVVLKWSYYSTAGYWQPLTIERDDTQMLYQSGRIWFHTPIDLKVRNIFPLTEQLYWLRVTVDTAGYELPPKINSIVLNTISASGVNTLAETTTYSSNGKCWQSFPTSYLALKGDNILQVKMSESDWKTKLGRELSPEEIKKLVEIEHWQDWHDYEIDKTEIREAIAIAFREDIPTVGKNNVRVISVSELDDFCSSFGSNGLPYQAFSLKQFSIATTSFQIQVREKIDNNYYWRDWIRVEDFDASGSQDPHYILDPLRGEICFGDGVNGKIPLTNYEGEDNIRVISCQLVRGELGNVEAKAIDEIYEPVSGLLEREFVTVSNDRSAKGGISHESLQLAIGRMRKELKLVNRTVTNKDFEQLTFATPGLRVARAKAILSSGDGPSSLVKVVVVPYSETSIPTPPSEGFLKAVGRHLNKHRLITTQIEVIPPHFVEVRVKAVVRIWAEFNPGRIRQKIINFLSERFLNPLTGGDEGKGWRFGRTVYLSEVYQAIENSTEAIDCVEELQLSVINPTENIKVDRPGNILLSPHSLVYSSKHQIEVISGRYE